MTTFGDGVYQWGGSPVGAELPLSSGKTIWLKAGSGTSGGSGKANDPVSTYVRALALATADANDIIIHEAEDNSASGTTDYQSASLAVSKDGVHIVGANSGGIIGQRSRIAQLSTATGISPLINWSANNSSMRNIHVFHGVDDATSKACLNVSGDRNYFSRCHIGGVGHATMDVADAYDLYVSGSENLFEDCTFGIDTVGRSGAGDAQYGIRVGGARNVFRNCRFFCLAEADTYSWIYSAANDIDRFVLFENCLFYNAVGSTGVAIAQGLDVSLAGSPAGLVILKNCTAVGATDWVTGGNAKVLIDGAAPTGNTSGLAVAVA